MTIHVVTTGYNLTDQQRQRCVNSCYKNVVQPRVWSYHETTADRVGAAYRRYEIIANNPAIADDDVVVLLGMDDELLPGALDFILYAHEAGAWVTWGNWVSQYNRTNHIHQVYTGQNLRQGNYGLTAPNTFRAGLYRRIPIERLQVDGEWQHVCTEVEVMYSCAEMAGPDRCKYIDKAIYLYNERLASGTLAQFGVKRKNEIRDKIQAREPMKRVDSISPSATDS
jgi:hypothetical protein